MRCHIGVLVILALARLTSGAMPDRVPLWRGDTPDSKRPDSGRLIREERYESRGEGLPNRWLTDVSKPVLSVYRPAAHRTTGAAVVVCPGGGYAGLAIDKEGHDIAKWLAERGVVGVVLPYRCGGGWHQQPVPWSDASRAIRTVRAKADSWDVEPNKIGVIGFSAGGHLAATAATKWTGGDPNAADPFDHHSSRPDFAVLVYPVISMREGLTHRGSRRNLLGENPSEELIAEWSADERVTDQTPPTLLIHSADDQTVLVENAIRFHQACKQNGVASELHVYPTGGHGYGMRAKEGQVATWPETLHAWLAKQGVVK